MTFYLFFAAINSLLWLIVPFRQFQTKYFLFFLFLALTDPICLSVSYFFHINTNYVLIVSVFFLIFSLFEKKKGLPFFSMLTIFSIIAIIIPFYRPEKLLFVVVIGEIFVLFAIIKNIIHCCIKNDEIKAFHVCLLFFQLLTTLKLWYILIGSSTGLTYFISTFIFDIGIALYFIFSNEKNSRILITL